MRDRIDQRGKLLCVRNKNIIVGSDSLCIVKDKLFINWDDGFLYFHVLKCAFI